MRESVKSARRFLGASSWTGYVLEAFGPLANATTDELLDVYIRNQTGTSAHPVGTARMTANNATDGVVNPDFCVKGAVGLRIVDASIFVSLVTLISMTSNVTRGFTSHLFQVLTYKHQFMPSQKKRQT